MNYFHYVINTSKTKVEEIKNTVSSMSNMQPPEFFAKKYKNFTAKDFQHQTDCAKEFAELNYWTY